MNFCVDFAWSLVICVFCSLLLNGRHAKWLKAAALIYALLLILCCKVQGTF